MCAYNLPKVSSPLEGPFDEHLACANSDVIHWKVSVFGV